ncbi:hypothetical protein FK268_02585 [Tsukamurella sputi]|uniref:Uncharacterized protein n=1 Tax=Tsukamurella sputi TaxID=2591848 RepID=A0A5C5RU84_9ACTN|nr:hypothetical protein [Tsukamurella sputi]TWS26152.1 hypothetical protein FK268_02585 [Tsukamurella sputi]
MDTADLHRATEEFAAFLSEAAEADLAAPAGECTVGQLAGSLTARAQALAAEIDPGAPAAPAPRSSDRDGGGFERPLRYAVRSLTSAAAAAPLDEATRAALTDLVRDVEDGAALVGRALGLA